MADSKKELIKLIDEISALKDKQQKLVEERNKLTAKLDSQINSIYTELDALYEKKRLCENEYLESVRTSQGY